MCFDNDKSEFSNIFVNDEDLRAKSVEDMISVISHERKEGRRLLNEVKDLRNSVHALQRELVNVTTAGLDLKLVNINLLEEIKNLKAVNVNLIATIEDLKVTNSNLKEALQRLRVEFDVINTELCKIKQDIGSRDLAKKVEDKVMKFIFPNCTRKPFFLFSYNILLRFLENPSSDDFTGPFGPDPWRKFSFEEKYNIQNRSNLIKKYFASIRIFIILLKEAGDKVAYAPVDYLEMKTFYDESDPELVEAIQYCNNFLDFDLTKYNI